ncbi:MAG: efflux RND transporter periplasmic adaptor subunit [Bacteroidia bacterium]
MGKTTKNLLIAVVVIGIAALLIIPRIRSENKGDVSKPGAPAAKGGIATVTGYVVTPDRLDNVVRTTGSILAFDEVDLKAETSGRITKIYFTEGSHVTKGALLLKINDDDLQAQLQKIELQIKLTESQQARQQKLFDVNATSKEEYDVTLNQLNSYKADRALLNVAIVKTEIRAPFNGVIGLRYVSEGSYVTPASRIAAMQNINPVKVDFSIPEKYAESVKKGDEIIFSNDESSTKYKGSVYAVEPKIDMGTRTLQVRAISDNKNEKLLPGSFAKIDLALKETNNALMIPTQALIPVLKGQNVFLCKDGVAQSVPVKTGVRTATKIQITEGLSAGDTVITSGIMSLKPDAKVNVVIK